MKRTYHGTKARNWSVIIKADAFQLLSGESDLSTYQFGTKAGQHLFCRHCGMRPFSRGDVPEIGGAYVSIALSCLDDIEPSELAEVPIKYMDGRHNNCWNAPAETRHL